MKRKNQTNLLVDLAELQSRPAESVPEDFEIKTDANPERDKYAADFGKSALTGKTPRRNKIPTRPPVPMTKK